jgi:antitoxin (DNA-binding transcriptional repressor) of toxin-antitoxin stability system
MQTRSISVTAAARNFSDCVNRARYQGVTFVLHRNGIPVARLVPEAQGTSSSLEDAAAVVVPETEAVERDVSVPARSLW